MLLVLNASVLAGEGTVFWVDSFRAEKDADELVNFQNSWPWKIECKLNCSLT